MSAPPLFSGYDEPYRFEYPTTVLTVAAVVALPVALVAVGLLLDLVTAGDGVAFVVSPDTAVPFALGLLLVFPVTIVLHELVHGLVANLLGYRVTYGTTRIGRYLPAAYAAAFGQRITRRDMALIAVAPLVVITAGGALLAAVTPSWLLVAIGAGMMTNAVGAVGDLYLLYRVARLPRGVIFYDRSIDDQFIFEPASAV